MATASEITATSRAMPAWLKAGLLSAALIAACWGGAIAFWRTTERTPQTWEIGLFLLGVPALLLTSYWLIPKMLPQRQTVQAKPQAGVAPAAGAADECAPLAILAAALRTPLGSTPDEVAAALSANKSGADIDRELLDERGFPVTVARVGDGFDETLYEEIDVWLAQGALPDPGFVDEQFRALTLGSAVLNELASSAATHLPAGDERPMMQVRAMLPSGWSTDQRAIAKMWLAQALTQAGWTSPDVSITADETSLAAAIAGLSLNTKASEQAHLSIILALDSNVGDQTIAKWTEAGTLFTSSTPHGAVPGEGAAGLLIAPVRRTVSAHPEAGHVLIHAMVEGQRPLSADQNKKTDAKLLHELAGKALQHARTDASAVAAIVADTGPHPKRVLEVIACAKQALPELDQSDSILHAGFACGACGEVPFMNTLVLAYHQALTQHGAVLALSGEDPHRRAAALLQPAVQSA